MHEALTSSLVAVLGMPRTIWGGGIGHHRSMPIIGPLVYCVYAYTDHDILTSR